MESKNAWNSGLSAGTYSYTVTAVWQSWTATSSPAQVTVASGAANKLSFTQSPGNTIAGVAFASQPQVTVQDQYGNTVTADSSNVTLAVTGGAAKLTSCAANPKAAVNGVATFSGCAITTAGAYTLTATDGSLTLDTSSSFTITAGTATTIAVSSGSPQSATVNTAFSPLVALVTDTYGNPVSGVSVTFTAPGSGASGTFGGLATVTTNGSGLATSPAFTANTIAGSYTVGASASGIGSANFSLTNTAGAAVKLAFTQQPSSSTTAGIAFATQPKVAIEDTYGNVVTGNTSSVTLTITGGGTTVNCTTNPLAAVSGVASFAGCTITKAGTYTLTATGSFTSATSNSFTITAGAPVQLVFTQQPSSLTKVGVAFATQPEVAIEDTYGNIVTGDTSSVTLAVTNGGATLTCTTNPLAAVSGVASFSGCAIGTKGFYSLTATDGTLTPAVSVQIHINGN